jgi:hypothetical protein
MRPKKSGHIRSQKLAWQYCLNGDDVCSMANINRNIEITEKWPCKKHSIMHGMLIIIKYHIQIILRTSLSGGARAMGRGGDSRNPGVKSMR